MKISRRAFVAGMGAAAVTSAGAGFFIGSARAAPSKRPNIILFLADDMRYDAAGYLGNTIIKTPFLDAMSKDSFIFDNNFVTSSVCCSSRASIMSGEYNIRNGVYDFVTPLRKDSVDNAFFTRLHEAGYHTGYIGKWGIGGPLPKHHFNAWHGYFESFHYYSNKKHHLTDIDTHLAHRFLRRRPADKPFLLVIGYKAPHGPLEPQRRYQHLYQNVRIPRAASDTKKAAQALPMVLKVNKGRRAYKGYVGTRKLHQTHVRKYYELITGLDQSVGAIIEILKHRNELDDTTLLFTSDNGMMLGEHGMVGKWCMYEESIRVPLMIRPAKNFFPDLKPRHIRELALNVDLSPTIMASGYEKPPANVEGSDLFALMRGGDTRWRDGFYYEHVPGFEQNRCDTYGYRGKKWKYANYFLDKVKSECLFNLEDDPMELNNLADNEHYKSVLEDMRRLTVEQQKALA